MTSIDLKVVDPKMATDLEPGMMWHDQERDELDRECWMIVLPNTKPQAPGYASEVLWSTTSRASKIPYERWEVTGSAPRITVSPSIDVECWVVRDRRIVREGSNWHGWIRDGKLIDA